MPKQKQTHQNVEIAVKRKTTISSEVKQAAAEMAMYFYEALRTSRKLDRLCGAILHPPVWGDLNGVERRAFRRAAEAALRLGANPREYVIAQFQSFAGFSQHLGRVVLPTPHCLATVAAQARYTQYKLSQEARAQRQAPLEPEHKVTYYRDERKLKGLARMHRIPPEDILTEQPEEFSQEFLKNRGVWPLVQNLWHERRA